MSMMEIPTSPRLPRIQIVRELREPEIMGYIVVTREDMSTKTFKVSGEKAITGVEFISVFHSAPWNYDDPDGDGVFKRITPGLIRDEGDPNTINNLKRSERRR